MKKNRKPFHYRLHDYFFPHRRNNHRPHLFGAVSVIAFVFAVLVFEGIFFVQTKFVFLKTDFLASVLPGALVALINQDRASAGLDGVVEDSLLSLAAQAVANDMATNGYFSHTSPDGKTPWDWLDAAGYRYSYAGQNLAINFVDSEAVQSAWMSSPEHRANIIKSQYTRVGFGVAHGLYEEKETNFVVEFFATPAEIENKKPVQKNAVLKAPQEIASNKNIFGKVLGSQTNVSVAYATTTTASWMKQKLSSPLQTLMAILTFIFAVVAISFISTVFIRGRIEHPHMVIVGIFLAALILGAMIAAAGTAYKIQVPPSAQMTNATLSH